MADLVEAELLAEPEVLVALLAAVRLMLEVVRVALDEEEAAAFPAAEPGAALRAVEATEPVPVVELVRVTAVAEDLATLPATRL